MRTGWEDGGCRRGKGEGDGRKGDGGWGPETENRRWGRRRGPGSVKWG